MGGITEGEAEGLLERLSHRPRQTEDRAETATGKGGDGEGGAWGIPEGFLLGKGTALTWKREQKKGSCRPAPIQKGGKAEESRTSKVGGRLV